MEGSIMQWLGDHHPDIHMELGRGIVEGDPERMEAMSSPSGLEEWLKRHHPAAYTEWEAASSR